MKGKTKAILAIIATVAVVSVAAVGTATFLKDSGEASAAEEPNITQNLPIAGRDNENPTAEATTPNESEQTGTVEGVEPATNPENTSTGSNNQSTGTGRTTGTTPASTTPVEPESTTITQERITSQETTLNWNNISLNSTISDKEINYTSLNYKVEYYYDGELDETKTDNLRAKYNEVIHECDDKVIPGYVFEDVENLPLTITENEAENVIRVFYTKRTDLTYTVNYLEEGTNNVLADAKTVGNQTYLSEVTEEAIDIKGYEKVEPTEATITIDVENNVINFYYTKRNDLSYTVNYLEQGTNNVLADAKTVNNQTFGATITASIEATNVDETPVAITGYNVVSVDKESMTLGVENNVINFYYTKRTDLSYTVNYLEEGTNEVLATAKTVNNQTFGATITASIEATNVDETPVAITGYNVVSVDKESMTLGVENNVINFYYTKRTDLSYTVNYLEEGTNEVLATAKTVNNQTFGATITASIEATNVNETPVAITGYNVVSVDKESLSIGVENNVINFYYTKKTDLSYTVNYLEEGTNEVLATAKTVNNQTFGATITAAIEGEADETPVAITGYNVVSVDKESLSIGVENNVINFYYTKRTDLSYTVNYLEEGTNKVLAEAKTVNNQTFEAVITASIEATVQADEKPVAVIGYTPVSVDKESMTLGVEENVINFYYTKRSDLSYKIEYYYQSLDDETIYNKDENVNDDVINNVTFETVVTKNDIQSYINRNEIAGYIFDSAKTDAEATLPLTVSANSEENVIKVYYMRNSFSYKVQHYTEKLDGTWELRNTDNIENVKFGANATYQPKSYTGFTFDDDKTTPKNATVPANDDLVIKLYYVRNAYDYTVNFYIEGESTPFETYTESAKLGSTVTVSQEEIDNTNKDARIYEYVPGTASVVIKESNNVINIYYKEIIKESNITEISTTIRKTNLVLVLDLSSSMTLNGSTRLADAKIAANKFIDQIYTSQDVSGINIKVVTFNSRDPKIYYTGVTECNNENHYGWSFFGSYHIGGTDCKEINGRWYSEYEEHTAAFSGTQVLAVSGLTNNTATNYSEAQTLKNAISAIYIPAEYQNGGYGTHMYAALQEANTQITALSSANTNNDNVVVFLSDGKPQDPGSEGYGDNTNANITSAAATLKGNATVYCIRLGNEAQNSTVFGTIATSSSNIIDANTQGDLINGFAAITEKENEHLSHQSSSQGIITINDVNLDVSTEKPMKVRKADNTFATFNSIAEINASGFISYDSTTKKITWDVRDYAKNIQLDITYHVN